MRAQLERLEELQKQIKRQEMPLIQKLLIVAMFCFASVLIGSYVAYLMGNRYFVIDSGDLFQNEIFSYFITTILFSANLFFYFSISLNIFNKGIFKLIMYYAPLYVIGEVFFAKTIVSSLFIPFIYILFVSCCQHKIWQTLISFSIFTASTFVYQVLSIQIKTNYLHLGYNECSVTQLLMYSIDLFLFFGLYYIMKGGLYNARWNRKYFAHANSKGANELSEENSQINKEYKQFSRSKRIAIVIIIFSVQIIQLTIVLLICLIGNVILEVLIILPTFWATRYILKISWHSESVTICTIISACIFYGASRFTIPAEISMFFPVIIGTLIAYSLYYVAIHFEEIKRTKSNYTPLTDREKQVQELKEVRGWAIEDIAAELDVHRRTVDRILKSIRQKNSR